MEKNIDITKSKGPHFIEEIIDNDLSAGKYHNWIITRFPPEPNGYLHIGHAKSIFLNFGLAEKYKGYCNLRFDDTNPETESNIFVEAIKKDLEWLGVKPTEILFASENFEYLYGCAIELIARDLAYVDELSSEEIAALKGTPTSSGTNSPFRNRPANESLELFNKMHAGKIPENKMVLRAKIDMAHTNMLMRDPIIYRVKHAIHHTLGECYCYPMYDFAHPICDSLEMITHSLCTLEFAPHRDFYNWIIEKLELYPSKQIEFARMNLTYTVLSKRNLAKLVETGMVKSWDDPRMPTISGMRRRGYPAAAIKMFCEKVGIAKRDTISDVALLESCVRDTLNDTAHRVMAILDHVTLYINNFPHDKVEMMELENIPGNENAGKRKVPFSNQLFIEKDDFMEHPIKGFNRLYPGAIVRLKGAYLVKCIGCEKDEKGNVIEVTCEYISNSLSGHDMSGVKAKGTIHWVSSRHAFPAKAIMYDRLFINENPLENTESFLQNFNHHSAVERNIWVEPSLVNLIPGTTVQFIRKGYFCLDNKMIFNRTVMLKEGWMAPAGPSIGELSVAL